MTRVPSHRKKKRKEPPRLAFFHLLALVLLFSMVAGVVTAFQGFYVHHWRTGLARPIAQLLPLPVASVNDETIWYGDVVEMAQFFDTYDSREGIDAFKEATDVLVRQQHIEQLGAELQVFASDVDVPTTVDQGFLADVGWEKKQYDRYVGLPLAFAQALEEEIYASAEYQAPVKDQIGGILQHAEDGFNFSDLAIQHSEGGAALAGGDVGYLEREDVDDGMEGLFETAVGEFSSILETERYFAIAYVYDAIEVEGERLQVGAQLITLNKRSLGEVLQEYIPQQEVIYHLN